MIKQFTHKQIREKFLNYFESQNHLRLKSGSLLPENDDSLLFTIGGMVPLKPYFLGVQSPPSKNMTSSQKCLRMNDLSEVGRTPRHHTFFEMLGNFSIGGYFKEDAIKFAWELLTKEYGISGENLWVTIHPEDKDSYSLWTSTIGIPPEKVIPLEDNIWQAGPVGPCGYDSEIYFDSQIPCSCGQQDCKPGCEGNRYLEVWNLVFMVWDLHEDGSKTNLPEVCVDTGAGLERLCSVLQGVDSNFKTDLFEPLINYFKKHSHSYEENNDNEQSYQVLADHLRGASFLIADGLNPSNNGQGYVLRKLIRRSSLFGQKVGFDGSLGDGLSELLNIFGEVYPELEENKDKIKLLILQEEKLFQNSLKQALKQFKKISSNSLNIISGEDAFKLYDTYGFPLELTIDLSREEGKNVDVSGFQECMLEHQKRSKALN